MVQFNEVQRQIADEAKLQEGLKIKREAQRNLEEDLKKAEAKRLAGVQMMKFMEQENAKAEKEKEKVCLIPHLYSDASPFSMNGAERYTVFISMKKLAFDTHYQ